MVRQQTVRRTDLEKAIEAASRLDIALVDARWFIPRRYKIAKRLARLNDLVRDVRNDLNLIRQEEGLLPDCEHVTLREGCESCEAEAGAQRDRLEVGT